MDCAYSVKGFQLYHGDALAIMRKFDDQSVDMIFADPPYFLSNGGYTLHAGKRACVNKGQWDESRGVENDLKFHLAWIEEARRLLKPNGTIWITGTYHSIYQCGYALQATGFHILNDIAWFKPNASPNLACRMFTASHETLLWARRDKKGRHYFNYRTMKHGDWAADALKKPDMQMRSVWSIPVTKPSEKVHGKHPTQKPIDLLTRIILASSQAGDVILDPFSGSSTTGIATAASGERLVSGIEMARDYIDLSIRR
ncbi:MAG: site-specific DNA-methyltransferase, partial [Beijerinckiaceae bacterium]